MSIASTFPVEIVDEILSHIEEPADLSPILFVSKSFKTLADRHIPYRVISCPLGVIQLWEHLSQNPSLAENVRVLEIQRRESDRASFKVPRGFYAAATISRHQYIWPQGGWKVSEAPYYDLKRLRLAGLRISEATLISALKNMSRLKSFKWGGKPPLIDSRLDGVPDDIWTALRRHETLTELDVLDISEETLDQTSDPQPHLRNIHTSLIFTLSGLTKFAYERSAYLNSTKMVPVEAMFTMLLHCPNLEILKLEFILDSRELDDITVNLSPLLSTVYWKSLHTIFLSGVHSSPSAAIGFLTKHPSIQHLHIYEQNWNGSRFIKGEDFDLNAVKTPALPFSCNVLPDLVNLCVPTYLTLSFLTFPVSLPRPLQNLTLWDSSFDSEQFLTEEFLRILGCHPTIYELTLHEGKPDDLLQISCVSPGIRVINIINLPSRSEDTLEKWMDAMAAFPNLEVLKGITRRIYEQPAENQDHIARELISRCPRLRVIQGLGTYRNYRDEDILLRNADGEVIWSFCYGEGVFCRASSPVKESRPGKLLRALIRAGRSFENKLRAAVVLYRKPRRRPAWRY